MCKWEILFLGLACELADIGILVEAAGPDLFPTPFEQPSGDASPAIRDLRGEYGHLLHGWHCDAHALSFIEEFVDEGAIVSATKMIVLPPIGYKLMQQRIVSLVSSHVDIERGVVASVLDVC